MKLDTERLREDLLAYHKMAEKLPLPKAAETDGIKEADEAQLVDFAATLGWDFIQYVTEGFET